MTKNDQTYWVGQKAFIRKGDDVLILNDPAEGLDFPGGKIQEGGEDVTEALKREVREEASLEINVGAPFAVWQHEYPQGHKYAGKKVYLVAFECEYVSGEVKLSHEHDGYEWVNKDNYSKVDDGTEFFDILRKYFKQWTS